MDVDTAVGHFAADVARDLQRTPRQLQSRYLYDELGSRLFEAICRLPWYRITRAEEGLLERHAGAIATRLAGAEARRVSIVELGVGSGEKLVRLIRALPAGSAAEIHLIDVSPAALEATAARVNGLRHVAVRCYQGTYQQGLESLRRSAGHAARTAVLLLGSNIGNFDEAAARTLLRDIRQAVRRGDLLVLGADLVKAPSALILAYDDPLGVTAAFNRNLLVRINRELGGDFQLDAFEHRALWNAPLGRVEMRLVSRVKQVVEIPAAGLRLTFEPGESIWTESSYKYTERGIADLGRAAGFDPAAQWIDDDARFALTVFEGA